MAQFDLNRRVALITGGAQGIGLALARALVRRGAAVALVDLSAEAAQAAAAGLGAKQAIGLGADVTDRAATEEAVAETARRLGGVDLVVANAGIAPTPAPVRAMPSQEFERVVEVNLLGVYRTVSAAMDQVMARRGQVVVVSSVYAFANGMLAAPYAVAKAGVEQLGRALRVELSPHGVGVTVAYFGFVDTEMVQRAFEQRQARSGAGDDLPAFLIKRITPDQAGEALARGIERRRARVIAPRWWVVPSVLRGILNPPLDYLSSRSDRVHEALRAAEGDRQPARSTPPDPGTEEVLKEAGLSDPGSLPSPTSDEKSR